MAKNIVLCCDGTGNEFGDRNSNVVKLYSVLDLDNAASQVAYYHPGLGTMGAPSALLKLTKWWTKLLGLAFGYGLADNLADAYTFLMNEYEPGDRVFVFGFSRGSYTARALCSMLHMFGLIRKGDDVLVEYATRMLKGQAKNRFEVAAGFKSAFSRDCKPHFVGVWDTVSSVGWIHDPVKLPYTANNPDIGIGRHAISIDERRCFYRQNLWSPPATPHAPQDLQQVWFAGVHSDIGGGYPEAQSGLAKITLRWMLREAAAAGLLLDDAKVQGVLGAGPGCAKPDPAVDLHHSLHGFWWLLECLPRRHSVLVPGPNGTTEWVQKWHIPLGRRRQIVEGSCLHESVVRRLELLTSYRPKNLPQRYQVVTDLPLEQPEPVRVTRPA